MEIIEKIDKEIINHSDNEYNISFEAQCDGSWNGECKEINTKVFVTFYVTHPYIN